MASRKLLTQYKDDVALIVDRWHKIGAVFFLLLVVGFPFVANGHWLVVANAALVTIVGSVGLMILTGFTGQISLGHAAFLAVGAYTAAILGVFFALPFWLIIPIAGFAAAAVGLLVGPFALRLEGLYLAIVTIGLLVLVNHMLLSFPQWTKGVAGIAVPMHAWFGEADGAMLTPFNDTVGFLGVIFKFEHKLYFVFLVIAAITVYLAKNIRRSNLGRALMAVRDHDMAAEVLGVESAKVKIVAFGVSSFFGGVAGAMFAYQQQFITVNPPFGMEMSVHYVAIVVLGGMGTVFGAVAGALFFVIVEPLAEVLGSVIPMVNQLSSAQQSTLLFSIFVIVFLVAEPLGLFGIWLRIKRYFLAWPFRY